MKKMNPWLIGATLGLCLLFVGRSSVFAAETASSYFALDTIQSGAANLKPSVLFERNSWRAPYDTPTGNDISSIFLPSYQQIAKRSVNSVDGKDIEKIVTIGAPSETQNMRDEIPQTF